MPYISVINKSKTFSIDSHHKCRLVKTSIAFQISHLQSEKMSDFGEMLILKIAWKLQVSDKTGRRVSLVSFAG